MTTGYRETRGKTGFFGTIFRILFWGWQALMIFWLTTYSGQVAPKLDVATSHAGHVIGATLSIGTIVFFWLAGSVSLGLFVLFTRGPKTLVAIDDD
jgi:hypothetical protein